MILEDYSEVINRELYRVEGDGTISFYDFRAGGWYEWPIGPDYLKKCVEMSEEDVMLELL